MAGVQTGHQRRTRRSANRGAAIRLRESRPFRRHAIKIRSFNQFLSVGTDVTHREIIAQNVDNIRLGVFRFSR